jgi:hypothetical protein
MAASLPIPELEPGIVNYVRVKKSVNISYKN